MPGLIIGMGPATKMGSKDKADEGDEALGSLEAIADDLLSAIESKDVKGIADALGAAFEMLDTPEE